MLIRLDISVLNYVAVYLEWSHYAFGSWFLNYFKWMRGYGFCHCGGNLALCKGESAWFVKDLCVFVHTPELDVQDTLRESNYYFFF